MRTFRWLALPLIGVALVTAACGDDGDSNGDGDTDTTETATSTATESTVTATSTAESTATESTETTDGEGDAANLSEIFSDFGETSFNVTYQMSGDQGEAMGGAPIAGEWKWIQDAENDRTLFEITAEGETVIMINTAEQSLLCAEGACFDTAGAMAGMIPEIDSPEQSVDELMADSSTASVREVDGREIAGADAKCVEFEDDAEGVTGTACYTDDGIPLLIDSTTPDGTFTMEAIEYSTDVNDSDFEAPFPVTALGQ